MPHDDDGQDDPFVELTPVQRAAERQQQEERPAERILYQHTVLCADIASLSGPRAGQGGGGASKARCP